MVNKLLSVLLYRETAHIPLIALGLKETKEVDFSAPFKVKKNTTLVLNTQIFVFTFVMVHYIAKTIKK